MECVAYSNMLDFPHPDSPTKTNLIRGRFREMGVEGEGVSLIVNPVEVSRFLFRDTTRRHTLETRRTRPLLAVCWRIFWMLGWMLRTELRRARLARCSSFSDSSSPKMTSLLVLAVFLGTYNLSLVGIWEEEMKMMLGRLFLPKSALESSNGQAPRAAHAPRSQEGC